MVKKMENYLDVEVDNETELYVDTIKNARLARAYVPFQVFGQIYSPSESFENGTAFPDLNYPEF